MCVCAFVFLCERSCTVFLFVFSPLLVDLENLRGESPEVAGGSISSCENR